MKLYHVCLEKTWERIHRRGFEGESLVAFVANPDHRGVWAKPNELICSARIDIPPEEAEHYRLGEVYRIPPAVANEYLERV